MNLKSIENEANIIDQPTVNDLDAASRIGPIINKHLTSLEALCKLVPNCQDDLSKLQELRKSLSQKINLQLNVLEAPFAREQHVQHHSQKSVGNLENKLKSLAKGSGKIDYDTIDREMQEISRQNGVTANDLHKLFAASHGGMTPDDYAKAIRDRSIQEQIVELFVEHADTLGESVWISISKHLRNQGYETDIINEAVNQAIHKLEL